MSMLTLAHIDTHWGAHEQSIGIGTQEPRSGTLRDTTCSRTTMLTHLIVH
jgi:hypothetical protein